jgi:pimeloyl-ACP methyl ester carboxylesterase
MKLVTERRELVTLDGLGVLLRGTFHKPRAGDSACQPGGKPVKPIGVVFLNSLSLPRAASGDSAVYWADSFADSGYPSFRFDLPGLGDTAGEIPVELLNFINAGKYGSITAAKMKELVTRFQLSGVVLVGHCAGAVSAIFAAAECTAECKGLVLLDPYFHLPQAVRPRLRRGLSDWALKSRFGGILSNVFDRLRDIRLYLRRNSPPQNANSPLLHCWKQLASTGLPVLLIKAPARKSQGTKPRVGEFDYLKYILELAGSRGQVAVELIEGTDHSFANRAGRVAIRQRTEVWLRSHLPLERSEAVTSSVSNLESNESNSSYNQYNLNCLQN